MLSRSPAWFGLTRPCSSMRCVPSIRSTIARGGGGLLDRQRLALARRRHERQHDQVGVGVEEHVLQERVAADAVAGSRGPGCVAASQLLRSVAKRSGCAPGGSVFVHAPVGFTKWPCTSKMNSPLSSVERASMRVERGFARQRRSSRRACRRAAKAAFIASSVVAAPHADTRKSRRVEAEALRVARRVARAPARARGDAPASSGIGANSPLVVVSSLIGSRRPSGSWMES